MDKYLVSLAFLLLFLEAGWLAHDLNPGLLSRTGMSGESLGKIVKTKSVVRKKTADSLIWEETEIEQPLFAYDSVLTMNQSAAELELRGDSHISLSENTMVIIEPPPPGEGKGPFRLRFKKGNLRAASGRTPTSVEAGDYVVEPTAQTKMSLRGGTEGGFNVEAVNGQVKLLDAKSLQVAQVIESGESVDIVDRKIIKNAALAGIEWIKPSDHQRIYIHEGLAQVSYLWEGDVSAIEVNGKTFEVGSPQQAGIVQNLALGDYVIKLISKNASSLSRTVHVWLAPKIYLISPVTRQRFKKSENIEFLWMQTPGVNSYVFELSQTPDFKTVFTKKEGNDLGTSIHDLPEGAWYWHVKGKDETGSEIPAPYSSEFFIIDKPLEAPLLKKPHVKKGTGIDKSLFEKFWELVLPEADASEVQVPKKYFAEFQWEKVEGAHGYVIEISNEPDFREVEMSVHVKGESYKWRNFKLGRYYWRVAGKDVSGQLGLFSSAAIADLTAIPVQPIMQSQALATPTPKPPPAKVAVAPPAPKPVATAPSAPEPHIHPYTPKYIPKVPWKFSFELGGHGLLSQFNGGDFVSKDFGLALGDFRFTVTPPPGKFKLWKAELEFHLLALRATPPGDFPFQDPLSTSTFRSTFICDEHYGFEINQYLGYQRAGLEDLAFQKFAAIGPMIQWKRDAETYEHSDRLAVLLGQDTVVDFSTLYSRKWPFGDTSEKFVTLEGRANMGLTQNRDWWFEIDAFVWMGLRW